MYLYYIVANSIHFVHSKERAFTQSAEGKCHWAKTPRVRFFLSANNELMYFKGVRDSCMGKRNSHFLLSLDALPQRGNGFATISTLSVEQCTQRAPCNAEKYGKTIFNQFSRRFKDGYCCDSDMVTPTMDRAKRKTSFTFR